MQSVAIVGVGLIGGSFALALRRAGFAGGIVGVSSPRAIDAAVEVGAIDRGATLAEACGTADLIYLAGPIHKILAVIPELDAVVKPGALVTDAGSTKSRICEAGALVKNAQFLGGHPMAGKESRGVGSAEATLFQGRPYLLTPAVLEDLETPAAREFVEWLTAIGAAPRVLSPQLHDRVVAHSSHLPQLMSTTLAAALGGHPDSYAIAAAAGPGLLDSTRLAMSAWEIWHDIVDTNRAEIVSALAAYEERLRAVRMELEAGSVEETFRAGCEFARGLRDEGTGK